MSDNQDTWDLDKMTAREYIQRCYQKRKQSGQLTNYMKDYMRKRRRQNKVWLRGEKTDFPKLFKSTYWGRCEYDESEKTNEIIQNRNWFAKEYNLQGRKKETQQIMKRIKELPENLNDHPEYYVNTKKEKVIIVSPYKTLEPNDIPQGWWICKKPLYENCMTLVCVIR